MKNARLRRSRPQFLNVRGLIFIYLLLCVLTVLFTRSFFFGILHEGRVPDGIDIVVFFTIPAVLLVFLGITVFGLLSDIISRRPGIKFKMRLLAYFIIIVIFAAVPLIIVTGISVNEIVRYWRVTNTREATLASHSLAVETFRLHEKRFDDILSRWGAAWAVAMPEPLPADIASVQDFRLNESGWTEAAFSGHEIGRLESLPSTQAGHIMRELPRDAGFIRYVIPLPDNAFRLISYSLGSDFDLWLAAVERQGEFLDVIDLFRDNVQILLLFFYGVFFLPALLMTMIIAVSFSRRVTNPIAELTEATRRVAEGDFSIQILARRGDELGLLIRSFNAMVQDLEKSRAALVKAEKISIWQNMAQQLAHEIKNPLTPIKLSAERVLRRWRNEPGTIGEIIEDSMLAVIQETEGLSTLLNEFRNLSKPTDPSRSWTVLGETVSEVIAPYCNSYPEIQFDVRHASEESVIKIDKHRFSQILTNLVINAIDAMDGKGIIEIRSDMVKKREIRYCRISIRDNGKGISKEEHPQVFTPYFTTKESGTGLGLPIVDRIVNDHNGAIWFNSMEGSGAVFFIDLPVNEEEV